MDLSYFGFEGMRTILNVHPAFVHFPIALLPTAFLLYFMGIMWDHSRMRRGARAVLLLAAASTIIAVITGLMAEGTFPHGEHLHSMIETHEMLGLIIMGLTFQPNFRYGEKAELERPWPHAELFLPGAANLESARLVGKSALLPEAVTVWSERRLLLDAPQQDPAAERLRRRFEQLPEINRETARRSLRMTAVRQLFALKKEDRRGLLQLLDRRRESPYDIDDRFYNKYLDDFLKANPGELEPAEPPQGSASRDEALDSLLNLSGSLGLAALREEVMARIGPQRLAWMFVDDDPEQLWPAEAGDEALLRAVLETVGSGETDRFPEAHLGQADWQRPLADRLIRLGAPEIEGFRRHAGENWEWKPFEDQGPAAAHYRHLRKLTGWACSLLDEAGLDRWGDLVNPLRFDWDLERVVLEELEKRMQRPLRLLDALFRPRDTQPLGDQGFQAALARLYARPEPEAHARVRATVGRIELPRGGEYYRRHECNDPYRWLCWEAWKRRDSELLANALERCALSYHTRGKPTVPEAPPNLAVENYAPSQLQEKGVSLEEVWRLVRERHPERVTALLESLLSVAELEDLPRVMLGIVAAVEPADLDAVSHQVLSLLESSQPQATAPALAALRRRPELARGREEEILETVARSLSSPSSKVAQEAAAALGTLGAAWPHLRDRAHQALLEALGFDTATVLVQVLKSLKEVRATGEVAALEGDVVTRLRELAGRDGGRFEKLTRQLLT